MTTELDNSTLEWAAQWLEGSLKGESNERVREYGCNMAMTLRAAKSDSRVSGGGVVAAEHAPSSKRETIRLVDAIEQSIRGLSQPRRVVQAITDVQEARESHVQWAAHLRNVKHVLCEGCDDFAAHIGDAKYHDEWIAKYDNVIAVLARTPFTAPPPTKDAAREAAYEIVGLERIDVHRVEEIIQRHCFPKS